jgi:transposase
LPKPNFVACFLEAAEQGRIEPFPFTADGLARCTRRLNREDEGAVEATQNIYHCDEQVRPHVARMAVVATYRFQVIARSKKKTDRADAAARARFLKLGWLPAVTVPSAQTRALRQLLEARETLVSTRTKLKHRGHAAFSRTGRALLRATFASRLSRARLLTRADLPAHDLVILRACLRQSEELGQEIAALEAELIARGKALTGRRRLLQVHGLNLLAAISLLAELGDITQFETSKQLVSSAGLATSTRQSNEPVRHGKSTKQGRKRLRTVVIQAGLALVNRTRTPLMEFYQQKKREKGAGKAICATARKLLTVLFVVLTKELDYWDLEDRLYNRMLREGVR